MPDPRQQAFVVAPSIHLPLYHYVPLRHLNLQRRIFHQSVALCDICTIPCTSFLSILRNIFMSLFVTRATHESI
jgi:hypothetical protein